MKDKITEYTDQLIKAATLPLLAEIEALRSDQKKKAEEIRDLEESLALWKGITLGVGVVAILGILYFSIDQIKNRAQ